MNNVVIVFSIVVISLFVVTLGAEKIITKIINSIHRKG